MKIIKTIILLVLLLSLPAFGQDISSINKPLKEELEKIFDEDQKYRLMIDSVMSKYGNSSPEMKELIEKMNEVDEKNLKRVIEIIDEYGWPGISSVGEKGNIAVWMVIQHGDRHPEIQKKYLPLLIESAEKGESRKSDAAYLEDRVRVNHGEKQIYGSQMILNEKTGKYEPQPIEDEKNVDKKRAEMGLPPLADYLKLFENKPGSDNKKDDLVRKGRIGVMVAELTDEIRTKSGLTEKKGVYVKDVFADTSAMEGGIKKEDIILSINGTDVLNVPQFLSLAGSYRAGEELSVSLWRNGEKTTKKITLKPFPEEKHTDFDILYLSVSVDETTTLRTIITKPKTGTKHPAVLLIQGLSCVSVDYPFDNSLPYQNPYKSILYSLTEKGFVTMRVEKSGLGDSTGTPAKDIDFNREVLGFQKALEILKTYDFVDKDKIFIFGHSMGGVMAPVIADNIPVKGIIVFGTIGRPMVEYELDNDLRQHLLNGEDFVDLEKEMRKKEAFLYHFYIEKLTPGEIIEKYPDCSGYFDDDEHMYGRHYKFLQQLYDLNLSETWKNVNTDVLAIWGKSDFVSASGDHKLIADIVNRYSNGNGTFMEMENIDHYFLNVSSMNDSYKNISEKKNTLQFNPVITEKIYEWMKHIIEKDSHV